MVDKQKKDINYYMSLKYKTEIEPISEENGGGYEAFYPTLGRSTFVAVGDTPEEALVNLREASESLFKYLLDKDLPIPLPKNESGHDVEYSGRILVRTTANMHRRLTEKAKGEGVSLNAYINQAITLGFSLKCFDEKLQSSGFMNNLLETTKESISQEKKFVVNANPDPTVYDEKLIPFSGINGKKTVGH